MLESIAMATPKRHLSLLLLASVLVLGACAHSRIVRRDYPAEPSASVRSARNHASPSSRAEPTPIPFSANYVVRSGETLYGISFRFGLGFQDVAAWNGISDPYVISVGQRLRLRPPPQGQAMSPRPSTRSAPMRSSAAPEIAATVVGAPATRASAPAADPGNLPISAGPTWRWPAQGQIIGRYVSGDQTQQGINIAGTAGQNIAAAADGVVVYSGAGLVGYGELIIIKHSDQWLSAYAHNRRRLVSEGTRVKAGDVIAEMGRTGAIRDMLHFEIRRNGKPVDPLVFLPRQ